MGAITKIILNKRLALFAATLSFIATGGCGKPKSAKTKAVLVDQLSAYGGLKTADQSVGGKKDAKKQPDLPGAVHGTGWHIPWYAPDPKRPEAPPQRVLVADARQGAMDSKIDVITIRLGDVKATLYHDGKPSATIVAPQVTTNEHDRILIATGGVTIHSLIDPGDLKNGKTTPANTTVTADKIVWDSHTTEVVCTGNPHVVSGRADAPDFADAPDRIIFNTETGKYHSDYFRR